MTKEKLVFTPENLIENIGELGVWSAYGLATTALHHYFPDRYNEEKGWDIETAIQLMNELGCKYWTDAVIKYHKEIGYKWLNPECVNEH